MVCFAERFFSPRVAAKQAMKCSAGKLATARFGLSVRLLTDDPCALFHPAVIRPQQPRRDAAQWPPAFGDLFQRACVGPLLEAERQPSRPAQKAAMIPTSPPPTFWARFQNAKTVPLSRILYQWLMERPQGAHPMLCSSPFNVQRARCMW